MKHTMVCAVDSLALAGTSDAKLKDLITPPSRSVACQAYFAK